MDGLFQGFFFENHRNDLGVALHLLDMRKQEMGQSLSSLPAPSIIFLKHFWVSCGKKRRQSLNSRGENFDSPSISRTLLGIILVGGFNHLEKYQSMGRIIPYIMENKTCLKPPTRTYSSMFWHVCWFEEQEKTSCGANVIQCHRQHTGSKPMVSAALQGPLAHPWRI